MASNINKIMKVPAAEFLHISARLFLVTTHGF